MFVVTLILKWKRSACVWLTASFSRKMFETANQEMNAVAQITSKRSKGREYVTNNLLLTLIFFSKEIFDCTNKFHPNSPPSNSHRACVIEHCVKSFFWFRYQQGLLLLFFRLIVLETHCKYVWSNYILCL